MSCTNHRAPAAWRAGRPPIICRWADVHDQSGALTCSRATYGMSRLFSRYTSCEACSVPIGWSGGRANERQASWLVGGGHSRWRTSRSARQAEAKLREREDQGRWEKVEKVKRRRGKCKLENMGESGRLREKGGKGARSHSESQNTVKLQISR
eukprot:2299621-Pleurochrysis_carterae.AAC.3